MSNPTHIFVILRIPPVLKYICIIKVFFHFYKKKYFLSFYFGKLIQFLVYVETASKNAAHVLIFYNEIKSLSLWSNENGCLSSCFIDVICIIKWIPFKFSEANIYGYSQNPFLNNAKSTLT